MTQFLPLYFIIFLLFFLIKSNGNTVCSTQNCGNVTIKYPFWQADDSSAEYCGYQRFSLSCSHGEPVIYMWQGTAYYVKHINYSTQVLTLIDFDIVDRSCPKVRHNTTLDTLPLDFYSPLTSYISFYYNCSVYPSSLDRLGCLDSGANRSYVASEDDKFDWLRVCQEKIMAPVMKTEIEGRELISVYSEAMNKGFFLNWRVTPECVACEASEGRCGYRSATKEFLCFCSDGSTRENHCGGSNKFSSWGVVAIGIAVGLIVITVASILLCYCIGGKSLLKKVSFFWKEKTRNDHIIEDFISNYGSLAPKRYNYSDIKKMTNSFTDKLGEGGYGHVYKGKQVDGRLVAVKILNESNGNGEEFINEVVSISRTSHVNVVNLLGFCFERQKRALIYEFMPNGSLDKFIYNERSLEWEKLYEIAIGIARGLEYLHRGCNTRILHFDIKPQNILLDEDLNPKISDFGLAKLCKIKESHVSMMGARGTAGYIAPEVFSRYFGMISHKSDVYSYGMMVLEMVGGRKNIDFDASKTSQIDFPNWVYNHLEVRDDLRINGVLSDEHEERARKMILVSLWCIQTNPVDRPSMSKVVEMLEGSLQFIEIPPKPFSFFPTRSLHNSSTVSIQKLEEKEVPPLNEEWEGSAV